MLCAPLAALTETTEQASAEQIERLTTRLLRMQQQFVAQLDDLTPPHEIEGAFGDYRIAITEIVQLNERPAGEETAASIRRSLAAAEAGVRAWEAKETANLPAACPPTSATEAYAFRFVAQGNAACFEVSHDLGALEGASGSQVQTARLIDVAASLVERVATALREALSEELQGTAAEQLTELYEERAAAIRRLKEAFLERDRTGYDRAARTEVAAAQGADRLAARLGMTQCLRLIGIGAT